MSSLVQSPAVIERTRRCEHLQAGKNYALAHEGKLL